MAKRRYRDRPVGDKELLKNIEPLPEADSETRLADAERKIQHHDAVLDSLGDELQKLRGMVESFKRDEF